MTLQISERLHYVPLGYVQVAEDASWSDLLQKESNHLVGTEEVISKRPKLQKKKTAVSNRKKDEVKILEGNGQNRIERTIVTDPLKQLKHIKNLQMRTWNDENMFSLYVGHIAQCLSKLCDF